MCAGGFYPDGIVLAGVTKTMAEQYAPEQLENGPSITYYTTMPRGRSFVF